jgi:predicted ribosome quality control (RQC) complex YloA/Tae2 family protein
MALDGFVLRALAVELSALAGGKITKIHQPNDYDIVMAVRCRAGQVRLLISANPTYPRLHLTNRSFVNPPEAPMFCMLLRKHCEGGIIRDIRQIGAERVLHLDIRQRDEIGDAATRRIVVELTGRNSNIILLDPETNTVLDGIRHVTPAVSSHRVIVPGSAYVPPPKQDKLDPFEAGPEEIRRALEQDGPVTPETVVARIMGTSPLLARELVQRNPDRVHDELHRLAQRIVRGEAEPCMVLPPDGKPAFSVTPLTHLAGDIARFATVSECLEAFYGEKAERDAVKQQAAGLIRLVQNELAKNAAKLEKLEKTLEETREADRYRKLGELVTASLHLIRKGDEWLETVDFYDESFPAIRIPLDPRLSPAENAQRYFKQYGKLKNSIAAVTEQIEKTKEEIRYLETVRQQLDDAAVTDLGEIREELASLGYIRERKAAAKAKKKPDRPVLTRFLSSEGVPIYVGKNNLQNDYLTNRFASPNDMWLHAKDMPGSHVVIRGEHGERTLYEAAMLAAWFSKGKQSSSVPVDYTLVRHVRKPSGAKPGFVIYEKQKTLFVTPDEQLIKSLKTERH